MATESLRTVQDCRDFILQSNSRLAEPAMSEQERQQIKNDMLMAAMKLQELKELEENGKVQLQCSKCGKSELLKKEDVKKHTPFVCPECWLADYFTSELQKNTTNCTNSKY